MKDENEVRKESFNELTRFSGTIAAGTFCVWLVIYGVIVSSSIFFGGMTSPLSVEAQAEDSSEEIVQTNESKWKKARRESKQATRSIGEATKETTGKGWDKAKATCKKAWSSTKRISKKTWKVMKETLSQTGGAIKEDIGNTADAMEGK